MGALLASQQRFAVLRKRLRQATRFPGERGGFAAQELKPVAAQVTARPIPRSRRGADGGKGGGSGKAGRAGVARGSGGMGQNTALTRRGF